MGRKPRYHLKHPGQSKGRFKRMLGRRFMVRFHMTLIVLAVLGAGLAISKFLLWYGVRSMAIRYPMVVLGGLVTFLICIRLWLWYIHSALVPAQESGADAIDAAEVATDGAELALDGADIAAVRVSPA